MRDAATAAQKSLLLRLRSDVQDVDCDCERCVLFREAADRIEALEASHQALIDALEEARGMVAYSASGWTHSVEYTAVAQRILVKVDAALSKARET